jgi:hypothetical protein
MRKDKITKKRYAKRRNNEKTKWHKSATIAGPKISWSVTYKLFCHAIKDVRIYGVKGYIELSRMNPCFSTHGFTVTQVVPLESGMFPWCFQIKNFCIIRFQKYYLSTCLRAIKLQNYFQFDSWCCGYPYMNVGGDCSISYNNNFDHYIRYTLFGGLYEKLNGRPAALEKY